jgi:hypothetical protein
LFRETKLQVKVTLLHDLSSLSLEFILLLDLIFITTSQSALNQTNEGEKPQENSRQEQVRNELKKKPGFVIHWVEW